MGITICVLAMVLGTFTGVILKKYLSDSLQTTLLDVFAFGAMAIGIVNINKANQLSYVIFALITGAIVGEILGIENKVTKFIKIKLMKSNHDEAYLTKYLSAIIVFCASGSGIFGSITEGISGDISILLSKAVLDYFTAIIFAVSIGKSLALVAIPEYLIMITFLLLGKLIMPFIGETCVQNFMSTGGIITFMAGLNILGIKKINVLNATPSLIIIFLTNFI